MYEYIRYVHIYIHSDLCMYISDVSDVCNGYIHTFRSMYVYMIYTYIQIHVCIYRMYIMLYGNVKQ